MYRLSCMGEESYAGIDENQADEVYLHCGIVSRGLAILCNYLYDDPKKFYEYATITSLYEKLHTLFITLHTHGRDMKNDGVAYVYLHFVISTFSISDCIKKLSFDITKAILDSYPLMFDSIYPPTEDAIIKMDYEIYEEVIAFAYKGLSILVEEQADVCLEFIEGEGHLRLLRDITQGCIRSDSRLALLCIRAVSKIILSISKCSYDKRFEDYKIYPLVFEILGRVTDNVVTVRLVEALSNFLVFSEHILNDLTEVENL